MEKGKLITEKIGNYKGLEVWVTNDDYWVTHAQTAVHSFGFGSGKNRIFIRKEAYDLFKTDPNFLEFMQTIYNHEYAEYLKWAGNGESPHLNGKNHREHELDEFLRKKGYFE